MMPSFFIAHGAPSIVIEDNSYTDFLRGLAGTLPRPKAIVLFSAHWEQPQQTISSIAGSYDTIYDFGGFQEELYKMTYPAPGNAALATEIQQLFKEHGIASSLDTSRGLDHGAWAILKLIYPDADIPVVALSVNRHLSNEQQYRIGQALAALKEQDILLIGSGGTVHNLRRVNWRAEGVEPWAAQFDEWLADKLAAWDAASLLNYQEQAPYAREAVPTSEHFIPLLLAMGTGDSKKKAELLHRSYQYGSLSLSCWKFE